MLFRVLHHLNYFKFYLSYQCCVAKSLYDLDRIDRDVFEVRDDVRTILRQQYSKGFGFVICKLRRSVNQYPIAYETDDDSDYMFVPTRQHSVDKV